MGRALLIIDVQDGMFSIPRFNVHEPDAVVARIGDLLHRARDARTPVFFVQHDGGVGHPLSSDGPGFAIRRELAPRDGETIVVKRHCNAFHDTDLQGVLARAGIDHLIVCGMQTEFCVDTAVRAAADRGYAITLVSDGHTTFDTPALRAVDIIAHHNATLGGTFAQLKSAAELAGTFQK